MITMTTLDEAMGEASRFIERARAAQAVIESEYRRRKHEAAVNGYPWPPKGGITMSSLETAAVRRASMDLTRALARLRKP